ALVSSDRTPARWALESVAARWLERTLARGSGIAVTASAAGRSVRFFCRLSSVGNYEKRCLFVSRCVVNTENSFSHFERTPPKAHTVRSEFCSRHTGATNWWQTSPTGRPGLLS